MKVIKRDGRAVDYDSKKIVIAINKANKEVSDKEKISEKNIDQIIKYIESLDKKRMLVEDIQDIIEEKLMSYKKYELAKKYIIYRYTRALVRKSNTTDESILGLLRGNRNNYTNSEHLTISMQRDLIAGEVSKDISKRILLPEKIVKAINDGLIYFYDMNYFTHPVFNSSFINLKDMLLKGTIINENYIDSPKSFYVASIVTSQIVESVLSSQYGGLAFDVKDLSEFLDRTYNKYYEKYKEILGNDVTTSVLEKLANIRKFEELSAGVQELTYRINTLTTINGKTPDITVFLNINKESKTLDNDIMLIREILNQRIKGIKDKSGNYRSTILPKLVFVINSDILNGEYDEIFKLALKCAELCGYPNFISDKKMKENYNNNLFSPMGNNSFLSIYKNESNRYQFKGRFNQGIVSVNLPQIGVISSGSVEEFWRILDERLDICKETLMCRNQSLLGTTCIVAPIMWNGAIARCNESEKIDKYLKNGYSTISLSYVGLSELVNIMLGNTETIAKKSEFAYEVVSFLRKKVDTWKGETGLGFVLYSHSNDEICYELSNIDKENYGLIKNINDKKYSDSYHFDISDNYAKIDYESKFQDISNGGALTTLYVNNVYDKELIKYAYDNLLYFKLIKKEEDK